jgi:hypothetical protein
MKTGKNRKEKIEKINTWVGPISTLRGRSGLGRASARALGSLED